MAYALNESGLDEAFEKVEQSILPSLSAMLDTLLETASLARAGVDAEAQAQELRKLALELAAVTREVEVLTAPPCRAYEPASISA